MKKILIVAIFWVISTVQAATVVRSVPRHDFSKILYYHNVKSNNDDTLLLVIQSGVCVSVFNQVDTRIALEKMDFNADVLWVEKYGLTSEDYQSECPQEYIDNNSPLQRLQDYSQVLHQLASQYQRIIVMGVQEGAAIASLLLADESIPIVAGIVINSGGGSYANDVIWQIEKSPTDVIDNDHPVISKFLEQGKQGDLPKNINFQNHGYRWWYEMLNTNMYETLKQSQKPLLIVQGLADRELSKDGEHEMYDCLTDKDNVTVYYYEDLNHEISGSFELPDINDAILDVKYWLEQL